MSPAQNPVAAVCNQTVSLERYSGTNAYGEATYETAEDIPARIEEKQNLKRDQQGVERLFSTRVLTVEEVALGDLINGNTVEARENIVDFFGEIMGWRSYL